VRRVHRHREVTKSHEKPSFVVKRVAAGIAMIAARTSQ